MNVTNEAAVATAFAETAVEFGGVDILVSNAGIASSEPIEETTLALWNTNMDILSTGYFLVSRALLCLDMGHFHPTENIADKLSAVSLSLDEILLHVSRPMRWDSDHVILLNDDILGMAQELVSADLLVRTRIGLDFFDATISRTAAWVIGTRNMQKALLRAMLLPMDRLKQSETALDFTARFALTEEFKDLPFGAVWNEFCARVDVPSGLALIGELDGYQSAVAKRG